MERPLKCPILPLSSQFGETKVVQIRYFLRFWGSKSVFVCMTVIPEPEAEGQGRLKSQALMSERESENGTCPSKKHFHWQHGVSRVNYIVINT